MQWMKVPCSIRWSCGILRMTWKDIDRRHKQITRWTEQKWQKPIMGTPFRTDPITSCFSHGVTIETETKSNNHDILQATCDVKLFCAISKMKPPYKLLQMFTIILNTIYQLRIEKFQLHMKRNGKRQRSFYRFGQQISQKLYKNL